MKNTKTKKPAPKSCKLICWSIMKDGQTRPAACPECGGQAEVDLDMLGRPAFFHKTVPTPPKFVRRKA